MEGEWRKTKKIDLTIKERRLWIEIPTGFTEMQQRAPERALAWRMDVRQMFEEYLGEGLSRGGFRAAARRRIRPVSAGQD